jgi:nitrogen fixation protein NifQ
MADARDIPDDRMDEYGQLVTLLMDSATVHDEKTRSVAEWIARSALEPGHLWRSMGLQSRGEVRLLMHRHFPPLDAANDKDMRWKKFLYKRMCGWSGFSA